jgi:hypothetical protein
MKPKTPKILIVTTVLLAMSLVVAGIASAADAPKSVTGHGRPALTAAPRFSLADAVAERKLDPRFVRAFRRQGFADGIVSFVQRSALQDAAAAAAAAPQSHSDHALALTAAQTRTLRTSAMIDAFAESVGREKADVLDAAGGEAEVLKPYRYLSASFVRFHSAAALLHVLADPRVASIAASRVGTLSLAESLPLIRQPDVVNAGYKTGGGTYIAVLDTGVDYTNSAFGNCTSPNTPSTCKVFYAKDFTTGPDNVTVQDDGQLDDDGHGTNVSGIAAGVAPATKLFALDVFYKDADGAHHYKDEDLLSALNAVIGWKKAGYNIRAINLSLGYGPTYYSESTCTGPRSTQYSQAFKDARAWGILPVVAAGNDAAASGYFQAGLSFPACVAGAIRVGAVYDSDTGWEFWRDCTDFVTAADQVTCFSQSGPGLTLLAPGSEITAAGITESGTSQATPHVAGAVAVLASVKPAASPDEIQSALATTGPVIVDDRPGAVNVHRLDLLAAVKALSLDTTPPTVAAPVEQLTAQVTNTTEQVNESWSATDASGIKAYALQVKNDSGAWSQVSLPSVTTTSLRFTLTIGHTYQFRVAAQDGAGNWSAYQAAPAFSVAAKDDTIFQLAGGWKRYSWTDAFGGTAMTSSTAGDWVKVSFTGRDVGYVAPKFSTAGRAKIWCDSTYYGLVDLYSSTLTSRQIVFSCRWSASGPHTMTIQVEGTSGRPRVDVDAFAVLG